MGLGDVDEPDADDGEWRRHAGAKTALAKAKALVALGGDGTITVPVPSAGSTLAPRRPGAVDVFYDLRDGVAQHSSLRTLFDAGLDAGQSPTRCRRLGGVELARRRAKARGSTCSRGCRGGARGIGALHARGTRAMPARRHRVHVSFDFSACDRAAAPAALTPCRAG